MAAKKGLRMGTLEGAPYWVGTHYDQLDFEWSPQEELELERYCEKIIKNAEEEEMTPLQRLEATFQGKEKDRLYIDTKYFAPYAARTLDSWADAVKPGDLYKWPKLHVKAHLATAARYKLDNIDVYTIAYTDHFWGANAKMIDYGTPMIVGDYPIKKMEDLEGLEVPDPKRHGLYPGYLWAAREIMRIMAKYGADKVLPIVVAFCGSALGQTCMSMTGFTHGLASLHKDPEFFKAAMNITNQWVLKFGLAVRELNPTVMNLCNIMGITPVKGNEWLVDYLASAGKTMKATADKDNRPYMWHANGTPGWMEWMPRYLPAGAIGPGSFDGWWVSHDMPYEEVYGYSREHDLVCGCTISDKLMLEGNMPTIEHDLQVRAECAKLYNKHFLCLGVIDYWTPPEVVDATLALAKKLGKF